MNQIQIAASEKTVRLLRTKKAAKNFQFLLAHNRAANALTMLGLLYRLSSVIITTYTEKPVQNSIKPTFFCRFKTLVGRRKLGRDKDIRPLELSSLEQILQCLFGILVLVPRGCIKCMSRYLSDELFVPVDCSRVDQSVAMFAECWSQYLVKYSLILHSVRSNCEFEKNQYQKMLISVLPDSLLTCLQCTAALCRSITRCLFLQFPLLSCILELGGSMLGWHFTRTFERQSHARFQKFWRRWKVWKINVSAFWRQMNH